MILGGFEVPLWIVLAGPVAALLYLYSTRTFNQFKKTGIPGPKPWPIIGTAMELYGDHLMGSDTKMFKKYGKFVGTFEGTTPVLMVCDPEWLKEAFVKNFSVFTDRRRQLVGGSFDQGIFSLEGDHWKYTRKMLSPEFSSGKLKKMMPTIQRRVEVFIEALGSAKGEPVDIRGKINRLTLDVISHTAFGMECDAQTNEDSQFAKNAFLLLNTGEAVQTTREKIRNGMALGLFLIAPAWLVQFVAKYLNTGILDANALEYFETLCDSVIEARRKDTPGNDFVQTLANSIVEAPSGDPDTLVDSMGLNWTRKGLTKGEVIGNAMLFLFAGFQTTADTLLFVYYELAHHPDIQQKLHEDIMEVCVTEELTTEQVNQVKSLEYCINETMRLYPQGFRFDRTAEQDITIRDIYVAKGTAVTASAWVIHRDPDIWGNPEDFDPDRFEPERFTDQCSNAFMPFGMGNRQCIGSRLALMEMKMAIILTLKSFTIEKCALTPARPLQFKATLAISPIETIMVNLIKR